MEILRGKKITVPIGYGCGQVFAYLLRALPLGKYGVPLEGVRPLRRIPNEV